MTTALPAMLRSENLFYSSRLHGSCQIAYGRRVRWFQGKDDVFDDLGDETMLGLDGNS